MKHKVLLHKRYRKELKIRDRLIHWPGRYLGFTDKSVWPKRPISLLTKCRQLVQESTCNEPSQDSYLAATLAGVFS